MANVRVFPAGVAMTQLQIGIVNKAAQAALKTCKFRPRLKAGMTAREANDALDTAATEFSDCMKGKIKRTLATGG
jgi:hypothetical protein